MPLAPKQGKWTSVPGQLLTKDFSRWDLRILGGKREFRYFVDAQNNYYDNVFAVVTLWKPAGGGKLIAGDLVFFGDNRQPDQLPIDLKKRRGDDIVVLFYGRQDFEPVLAALTQSSGGTVSWDQMQDTSGGVNQLSILAQMQLDPRQP
jgi:hypothetical protein